MNLITKEYRLSIKSLIIFYYIFFSTTLIVIALVYIYFSLQNQVSEYENLFVNKLKSVIKLHSNELLDEVALNDTRSLLRHVNVIKNEFKLDSVRLTNNRGLDVFSKDDDTHKNGKLSYMFEYLDTNPIYSIKFAEYFSDHDFRFIIDYRTNIFNNAIVPYVAKISSMTLTIIAFLGVAIFIFFLSIKILVFSPLQNISKHDIDTNSRYQKRPGIRVAEITKLFETLQNVQHLKVQAILGQMAQLFAHDVRKPFSQMRIILDALQGVECSTIQLDSAKQEIEKAAVYVEKMIADILDFSREVELYTEPCSLHRIFNYVTKQSLRDYPQSDIFFDDHLAANHMPLVDEERIARVFTNIIGNAVEAITTESQNQNGVITISSEDIVHEGQAFIKIVIGNNGPLLNEGIIEKLFDSFFTYGKSKGTGLGLASARKIVHLHKGTITAHNKEDGKGVEFVIKIKASGKPEPSDPVSFQTIDQSTEINVYINRLLEIINKKADSYRVLLLEDEGLYRASIKNLITNHDELKHKITIYDAHCAEDGLKILEGNPEISYAIVDINLGAGIDGYEFVKKSKQISPHLSILIHSDNYPDHDPQKARELGVFGFAPKPLSLVHLAHLLSGTPLNRLPSDSIICENRTDEPAPSTEVLSKESPSATILVVDDDKVILDHVTTSLKECLTDPSQLVTASTFRQAAETIENCGDHLTHIFCDLNIDSANDGLQLATMVREQNKDRNDKTDFYIITHADTKQIRKRVGTDLVKRFVNHPLDPFFFAEMFPDKSSAEQTGTSEIRNLPRQIAKPSDCTLPELIENADKEMMREMRRFLGHDVVGELNLVFDGVTNSVKKSTNAEKDLGAHLFKLYSLSEQLNSVIDIIKFTEKSYRDNLFVVPFELKHFVDRFIKKQQPLILNCFNRPKIENLIYDSTIKLTGDERIFEKAVQKVFINVLLHLTNMDEKGWVDFSVAQDEGTHVLQMTCNVFDEKFSETFFNDLLYNTPWSSRKLNLDYVACGYLLSLIKGNISIQSDPARKTTSFYYKLTGA